MSTLRVDQITDEEGTGAPDFPNGLKADTITDASGTGAPDFPNGIASSAVTIGNWAVTQDNSGSLLFSNGANVRMKLDTSGNLTVTGDVTAFGTI